MDAMHAVIVLATELEDWSKASDKKLVDAKRIVRPYCILNGQFFAMQAGLLQAQLHLEEHEKSGSGIGLAIQQLRAVVSQQEKARAALGKWTELVGEGKAEWHIRRMDGQAAEASKLLAEAEKDNDEVYFAMVPSDAPPAVEAKVFVTAMPVGENAEYNNHNVS